MDEKGLGALRGGEMSEDAREARSDTIVERLSSSHPLATDANDDMDRTRLITHIARLIRETSVPESTRLAGLTLIGWLARRGPNEAPHAIGIEEARESERRIRTRAKSG
jgi:hypothetical protein